MRSDENERGSPARQRLLAAVAVAVLACVPYAGLPAKPLIYDAPIAILSNDAVQSRPLSDLWTVDFWGFEPDSAASSRSYRPLVSLGWALQARALGNAAFGYHLVDIALHAANSALVVFLLAGLGFERRWWLPLGALFALHPLQSEAVVSAVGRADLMAAGCLLAALTLLLRRRAVPRPTMGDVATIAFVAAAFLCKEYAVAFPFVLLVVTWARSRAGRRPSAVEWGVCGVAFALLAGYLGLRLQLFGAIGGVPMLDATDHPLAGASTVVRIATGLSLIPLAARLIVLPVWLNHHYRSGTLPVMDGLLEPAVLVGVLLAACLIAFALYLLIRRRDWIPIVAVALIALPLAPSINLFSLSGVVFAERFLYLPVAGFVLLVGWACRRVAAQGPARFLVPSLALVALVFGGLTVSRVAEWESEETLARASLARYPGGSEVWRHLGVTLARQGRDQEAAEALTRSLDGQPDQPQTWRHYATVLDRLGRTDESVAAWRRTLELSPDHVGVLWRDAGIAELRAGNLEPAIEDLGRAHRLMPGDPTSLYYLARAHLGSRAPATAVELLRAGGEAMANDRESLEPLLGQALLLTGRAALDDGRPEEALALASEAAELPRLPPEGHFLAGLVAHHAGDPVSARRWFDLALARDPELLRSKHEAAGELERAGRHGAAAEQYREVLAARPDHSASWFNLGRLLMLAGRTREAIEPLERGLALVPDARAAALLEQARREAATTDSP